MGVGVPLFVILVLSLVVFLIYEHRLRIKAEKTVSDTLATHNAGHLGRMRQDSHQWKGHPGPLEAENSQIQPGELFDGEVYEVGGTY